MSLILKAISSMNKCFMDESIHDKKQITCAKALRGEEFAFEIAYADPDLISCAKCDRYFLSVQSPLAEHITVRRIEQVPVRFPCFDGADDYYLRKTPGLYPDLLGPVDPTGKIVVIGGQLQSLLVTVFIPDDFPAGEYPVAVSFITSEGETAASASVTLKVIGASLPKQDMIVTQWFHADCIADYYELEVFSEKHWEYIENFMATAVKNGINTILMPVFTPPLDTAVGGERTTVQLVDVEKTADGWKFGFDKLERWIEIANRVGVEYHEVSHLYTQWGVAHAPKVMATVDGEHKRIFGWETDSLSDEYKGFLRAFIAALNAKMDSLGIAKDHILYHISDEPGFEHLEAYRAAKAQIEDLLEGYTVMDALSSFSFYQTGVITNPIPSNDHIDPFIEAGVEPLWTYYCCGQGWRNVSNRFIAMPMQRTRVIGMQFWKYRVKGFLQWGYNFYNTQYSTMHINPHQVTDGNYFAPAGDCFSVYPGVGGEVLETMHLKGFTYALQDTRLMNLAEKLAGREAVLGILEECGEVTFSQYSHDEEWLEGVRGKICDLIDSLV
ncbi:MAG: DUF4091 domain-containing protein [Oscillospiraceae bacterium]|nr:DUF4091 domain-containing protein [Oscillospiraceae bacterium]